MVRIITSLLAFAAVVSQVSAAPLPNKGDSALGEEVAVSAPAGIPITDSVELASQLSTDFAYEATSTSAAAVHEVTSSVVHEVVTSVAHEVTTTAAPAHVTSSVAYGSGYNNWGGAGYDDCVQQCIAQHGKGLAEVSLPVVSEVPTATGHAGGVTHTVIVAPTQGVLRYVPYAVNASVGDTVRFMWGAGPHTVTKSSALQVCNKSLDANSFASGMQNKSFIFDQVVNNTDPTFFYCAVPSHCQKGMFGVINPPMIAHDSPNSMGSMMADWAKKDSDVAAMWSYTDKKTKGTDAWEWGNGIDMSSMPETAYKSLMENTLYGRLFYGANPGMVETGKGAFAADGSTINIPQDISVALAQTTQNPPATSSGAAVVIPTTAAGYTTSDGTALGQSQPNSARSLVSSTTVVGAIALVVSFLAL